MDMDIDYAWRFTVPGPELVVHMESFQDGRPIFDANLSLRRQPMTKGAMVKVLGRYPLMGAKVVGAIYWQAFRLWLKRTPFFTHPAKRSLPESEKA